MGKATRAKMNSGASQVQTSNPHVTTSWFWSMLQRGRTELISGFFTITPEIADQMLSANESNRTIRPHKIKEYQQALKSGRFAVNGEAIIVAKDGALNDGQHRLLACVESGVPFVSNVAFGVERDTRFTVDTGSSRSNATMLAMLGVPHATSVAASIGLYYLYEANLYRFATTGLVSGQDEVDFYLDNTRLVTRMIELFKHRITNKLGAGSVGGAFLILYPRSPRAADEFFHKLVSGENLSAGDPILLLRNRLTYTNSTKMRNHIRLELILRAWNAFRRGEHREQLRSHERYPEKIEL